MLKFKLIILVLSSCCVFTDTAHSDERELIVRTEDSEVYLENREGTWFLTGEVSRSEDARLARETVLLRDNVIQLEDQIQVRGESPTNPEEAEISASDFTKDLSVNLNLLLNPDISGASIQASHEDGHIILEGTVETEAEKLLVQQKVKQKTGVDVINRLEVGSGKNLNEKAEKVLFFMGKTAILIFILAFCLMAYLFYKNNRKTISSNKE